MTRRFLMRVLVCALCLTGVSLRAQTTTQTGSASISGRVVDDDGKPIRRVSVIFEGDTRTNRTAITDDRGTFSVTAMPAARYAIRAEKGGYPSVAYGAKRPGRPGSGLLVRDGQQVADIVLRMSRGAVITGTVFDDRGRPLPGASVTAYQVQTNLGGDFEFREVVKSGSSFPVADDRGIYRLYGLPAGEYIVGTSPFFFGLNQSVRVLSDAEIRAAFGSAQQGSSRAISTDPKPTAPVAPLVNYAKVYFGDVLDPATSTRVRVAAGEERAGIDLHLTLMPRASIAGTMVGPDPLPTVELTLAAQRGQNAGIITVRPGLRDSAINFTNQPPGDYVLTARTTGTTPAMYAEQPITIIDRDVTGFRLELQAAMTMTGHIVFDGTSLPPPDSAKVVLSPNPVGGRDRSVSNSAEITPTLDFTFSGVMPGRFRLAGAVRDTPKPGAPAWTLASVMIGGRDVTDLPVDVVAGQPPGPLTVTFTDHASEVHGSLVTADGKPGTDYFVVVFASDERYWIWNSRRIKSTRPDASGQYSFPGLPPGTYRVAAITELEQGDLTSRTFLRDLVANSAEVIVGVGEKKVFDLKLGGG